MIVDAATGVLIGYMPREPFAALVVKSSEALVVQICAFPLAEGHTFSLRMEVKFET